MGKLIVTRGLPGSGKSTWGLKWVSQAPETRRKVNRDDLRAALFSAYAPVLSPSDENYVTKIQRETITKLLSEGFSVVVDDTNLRDQYVRDFWKLALDCGAEFSVQEFRDVPLITCIARDEQRGLQGGRRVSPEVITNMHQKFIKGRKLNFPVTPPLQEKPMEFATYIPNPDLPKAVIFDIDGTLANHVGIRNPYDFTKYHLDTVHEPVRQLLRVVESRYRIIIATGRDETYRTATEAWLMDVADIEPHHLVMRPVEFGPKKTKDYIVKEKLFREQIAPFYNVLFTVDDRDQVVNMWRQIGLTCFQCREGNF